MKGISVGVWSFGMGSERYVSDGYKPFIPFTERVSRISNIDGLSGIEICYPNDVNEENLEEIKAFLAEKNLKVAALGVELVCDKEWQSGSFSSSDPARRQKSIELTKAGMDIAAELGTDVVALWLGQDGFDYVLQADYVEAWKNLVAGLKECAQYRSDIKLGIEYKISEPKMNCYANSGGKTLALALATGMPNVGVTLDVGHAFNARENPAEIASILLYENRLFHVHLNDNYGFSDDDMPVGTVHWPQYVEFFYWLEKLGYAGWYSLDLYPYRDDATAACEASIVFVQDTLKIVHQDSFEKGLAEVTDQAPGKILKWLYQQVLK
jgi:xylose isomerase